MEKKPISGKSNTNFIIDILLLLVSAGIVGIGFLIKYVLLTGEQKRKIFGANIEQTFLGLDRHGWGDIHLYLGFTFLILLLLHIVFHWSMIVAMFGKFFGNMRLKKTLTAVFLFVCFLMVSAPFFIEPKNGTDESKHANSAQGEIKSDASFEKGANDIAGNSGENKVVHESHKEGGLDIRGYMSIEEVCKNYNIPAKRLKDKLGVPVSTQDNTPLSVLRKQYGIKMSTVEEIIIEQTKKKN